MSRSSSHSESKLRGRVESLQRSLDSTLTGYKKLKQVLGAVAQALEDYPDTLPQSAPQGLNNGQYQYLLDCLRARMRYHSRQLQESDSDSDAVAVSTIPPRRKTPLPPQRKSGLNSHGTQPADWLEYTPASIRIPDR
jgi:hypothetical protein